MNKYSIGYRLRFDDIISKDIGDFIKNYLELFDRFEIKLTEDLVSFGKLEYILKISEKMLRTALILWTYFNTKDGNIIFACPKINPSDYKKIKERVAKIQDFMKDKGFNYGFSLVANENFEQVIKDVIDLSVDVADTSELFLRSCQLCILTQKNK